MSQNDAEKQTAVFGGGCFWCTEAVFKDLRGVMSVMPGYAGGQKENPIYEEVCSGKTGHAEVIKIEFDPARIRYDDLLTVFFATHDPTTPDRQGNDVGTQYRSLILYTTEDQKNKAENFIRALNASGAQGPPVVTEVKPLETFYEAEQEHRGYYEKNRSQPYCRLVIHPKLEKVRKEFAALLKSHGSS